MSAGRRAAASDGGALNCPGMSSQRFHVPWPGLRCRSVMSSSWRHRTVDEGDVRFTPSVEQLGSSLEASRIRDADERCILYEQLPPGEQQFAAKMPVSGATVFECSHPRT